MTRSVKVAKGTISVSPGSDLRLRGRVRFDWIVDGLKGNEYPMVYVAAWQDVNQDLVIDTRPGYLPDGSLNPDMVYGQLDHPDGLVELQPDGSLAHVGWVLGGGSSAWLYRGGPAKCRAYLMVYGGKHGGSLVNDVLATVDFDAGG